jgi:hypothetical protein
MATVAEVIERARQRADMVSSGFITSGEAISLVANSYYALYDMLVAKFEDYYSADHEFTITSGDSEALPSDFYKLRGLDIALDGVSEWYPLKPFLFSERAKQSTESVNGTYKLWYIPKATAITTTAQTIDGVNGWEEYVVVDAARKMLIKEESDPSPLLMELAEIKQRITEMAAGRDSGSPQTIADVRDQCVAYPDVRYRILGSDLKLAAFGGMDRRMGWFY